MINSEKIIALIPIRGGSKRIPRKNVKPFNGHPLAYWAINAALKSKFIDDVYVSTEDGAIKETVIRFDPRVKVIDRPQELAQDTTAEELVHMHAMENLRGFDIMIIVHATNPLTASEDLDAALERFVTKGFDSMLTGTLHRRFYWTRDGRPLNYDPSHRPRTQDFEGTVTENGSFYITRPATLRKYKNFLGGKIGIYEMPAERSVDIDELSDWEEAERRFKLTHE